MKLSILIPTLPEPDSQLYLNRLMAVLVPQVNNFQDQVEIKIHDAPRSMPTGTKRNEMIAQADGEYFVFIDCDDMVPSYYVEELVRATESNPDVITFNGYITTNGSDRVDFIIKLGEAYEARDGKYFRFPNHLCAFKKRLVKSVKFPPVWHGEDYRWALQIHERKILRSEIHIDKEMYHYDYKLPIIKKPTVSERRRNRSHGLH